MKYLNWIQKIFIINLDHSIERWEKCKTQLDHHQIEYERFSGIYGNKIPSRMKNKIHFLCDKILCSNGMKGCALSHLSLLERIVREKIDTALILEDDFIWTQETTQKIDTLENFRDGIVKLNCIGPFCIQNVDRPTLSKFSLGNGAYLIRLEHAEKLYQYVRKIYYHIDIQFTVSSKLYSIPMYEYPCFEIDGYSDSTIASRFHPILNLIPIHNKLKWTLSEPFIAPLGKELNLFTTMILTGLMVGLIYHSYLFGKLLIIISLVVLVSGVCI
jgi:GR25 family glycosyltransferase involved in LPS biosynthesis